MTRKTKKKDRSHTEGQKWKCSVLLNIGSQKRMGQSFFKILKGNYFSQNSLAVLTLNEMGGLMKDTFRHSGPQKVMYFYRETVGRMLLN